MDNEQITQCSCGKSVRTAYYQKHLKTNIHEKRTKIKAEKRFQFFLGKVLVEFK